MKKGILGAFLLLLSVIFFTACEDYPGYDDYVDEQLVPVSSYNESTNFGKYKTFSIADSVAVVNNKVLTKVAVTDPQYPQLQAFAKQVSDNMAAIGYTLQENNPDLGITLSLVKSTNVYVTYPWWWYWNYCYWDYWDCGWYPYYPYPYPVVVGGYDVGLLAMDMFDLKAASGNQVPAIWSGIVRGLYVGNGYSSVAIAAAIDQCFNQTAGFSSK